MYITKHSFGSNGERRRLSKVGLLSGLDWISVQQVTVFILVKCEHASTK